jgi:phosphoglycolate phosphatase
MERLILFDIDGTLLSTDGAARRAFHRGLLEVYGTAGPITNHPFDGKTDPQIARELLSLAGIAPEIIAEGLEPLWEAYLRELVIELDKPGHETTVYPGVIALLDELAARGERACLGLLTGNISRGAQLKLSSAGLADRFSFGAFGSDCERRDGLPAVAVQRALQYTGRAFSGKQVVVIGDTPHDVRCGQALGVFALGVGTGRHSSAELLEAGADAALPDLSSTNTVLDLLLGD